MAPHLDKEPRALTKTKDTLILSHTHTHARMHARTHARTHAHEQRNTELTVF